MSSSAFNEAGRNPDFHAQQITDFQARLSQATGVIPAGAGYTHPVRDYLTSEQGAAVVLDHHVNRPGHVDNAFGAALDTFYAANPQASRYPSTWTAKQRAEDEPALLGNYRNERASETYKLPMTHATERAEHLTGPTSTLSAVPGPLHRTPNE